MDEEDSTIIHAAAAAAGSESCEDLKSKQENVNPLQRSFPDADENEDGDDEDDSDSDADEEDSNSDSDEEEVKAEENRKSDLQCLFMDEDFIRLAKTLVKDPTILQLFRDVLKPLKKKDVTPDDVDEFYAAVSRVLTNEFFARNFYAESVSSATSDMGVYFIINVRRFGILNKMRADAYGKTDKLMTVIKKDSFFDDISKSENDDMITRGVSGILIAFCISEPDLEGMARLIGIQEPEVWVDGPSSIDTILSYSIKDNL